MPRFFPLVTATIIAVLPFFSGCMGGSSAEFPTTPVTLKVMYKGLPVEDASVAMINSADYGKAVIAVGRTNAQGEVQMRTYADSDGAVKGSHLITITKMDAAQTAELADTSSADYNPNVAATPAPKSLLPIKYSTPASGLSLQVGDTAVIESIELVD